MLRKLSWATLAVGLCAAVFKAQAFDVAIYKDPLSEGNSWYLNAHRHHWFDGSDSAYFIETGYFPDLAGKMDSAYRYYQELGVTKVMVNYLRGSNFDMIPNDISRDIKVMNWNYPGPVGFRSGKYMDAQFRDVQVGLDQSLAPTDRNRYWSYHDAIGAHAQRYSQGGPQWVTPRPVVVLDSCCADTMWRAASYLGNFSGWDGRQTGWLDGSIYTARRSAWMPSPT